MSATAGRARRRHVLGTVGEFPPGTRRRIQVEGRAVAIFNERGRLYALRDACPHRGAQLSAGTVVGALSSPAPGCYATDDGRRLVKCPWHGWEFDLVTGQSWCEPERQRVRSYEVGVRSGEALERQPQAPDGRVEGPYKVETIEISVHDDYVVIDI